MSEETKESAPEGAAAGEAAGETTGTTKKRGSNKAFVNPARKKGLSRKTMRAISRKRRREKILMDPEFRKQYFEAKSKRTTDKKKKFRKRYSKKQTAG